MKKHVILDTDIGGDPDDAVALLLGLNSPEIKIDLIITSDEHKGHRAIFAEKILAGLDRQITVARGIDINNSKYCMVCDIAAEEARCMEYIKAAETVIANNTKTYYACIGPQSNLASLIGHLPRKLRSKLEIVIMGGAINYRIPGSAEHNIRLDTAAAQTVFNSDLIKRYVISDTTYNDEIVMDEKSILYKIIQASSSPAKDIIIHSFQNFFKKLFPKTFMHDPLTFSYLINPDFLKFETKLAKMDEKGVMCLSESGRPTILSSGADYKGFMSFLEERVNRI